MDGTRVGEAQAAEETPHHIIHRLCELDLAVSDLQQPPQQKGVGFRLKLPNLMQGKHEVHSSHLVPARGLLSLQAPLLMLEVSIAGACILLRAVYWPRGA